MKRETTVQICPTGPWRRLWCDFTAIKKIIERREYWLSVHETAYRANDEARWRNANEELGRLWRPFEELTGRVWYVDRGGMNDKCWTA